VADITSSELAKNTGFQGLLLAGLKIMTAQAGVISGMDTPQLRAYMDKVNELRADLKSRTELAESEIPGEFSNLTGLSPSEVRDLVHHVREHATELNRAFPELHSLDGRTKQDLLVAAIKGYSATMATIEGALAAAYGRPTPDEQIQDCLNICFATFSAFMLVAMAMYAAFLVGCASIVLLPPLMVLCILVVTTGYVGIVAGLVDVYNYCTAGCLDLPSGP
jgi:hypothetical protein